MKDLLWARYLFTAALLALVAGFVWVLRRDGQSR